MPRQIITNTPEGLVVSNPDGSSPLPIGGGAASSPQSSGDLTALFSLRIAADLSLADWEKGVKAVTVSSSPANGGLSVHSTTGYAKMLRWDGTFGPVSGTGDSAQGLGISRGAAPVSPYNTTFPKFFAVFPCNVTGVITGHLTIITISNCQLTALSCDNLPFLNSLLVIDNQLTSLVLKGLSSLETLSLRGNQLTTFSCVGLPSVVYINIANNLLESFVVGDDVTELIDLNLGNNRLTSFDVTDTLSNLLSLTIQDNLLTSLTVSSGSPALTSLYIGNNRLNYLPENLPLLVSLHANNNLLTSFDGSSMAALYQLVIPDNLLSTFSAAGMNSLYDLVIPRNALTSITINNNAAFQNLQYSVIDVTGNDLDASALNALYSSLPVTTGPAPVTVTGNPGAAASNELLVPLTWSVIKS